MAPIVAEPNHIRGSLGFGDVISAKTQLRGPEPNAVRRDGLCACPNMCARIRRGIPGSIPPGAERRLHECHTCTRARFWMEEGYPTDRLGADYATCAVDDHIIADERGIDPSRKMLRTQARVRRETRLPVPVVWHPSDFLAVLRQLERGKATIAAVGRMGEFDIANDGMFSADQGDDRAIRSWVITTLALSKTSGVTVRTFRPETVAVPHGTDRLRIIRVPLKDLRGFLVQSQLQATVCLCTWSLLSADEVREAYTTDPDTGVPQSPVC